MTDPEPPAKRAKLAASDETRDRPPLVVIAAQPTAKRRPRLRGNGRFLVLWHATDTGFEYNELDPTAPHYLLERGALRRRMLRFFFCSAAFPSVFFDANGADRKGAPVFGLNPWPFVCSSGLKGMYVQLSKDHVAPHSIGRLLQVARLDRVLVSFHLIVELTAEHLREVAFMLSTLKGHRTLAAVELEIIDCENHYALIPLLLDFLPHELVGVSLTNSRHAALLIAHSSLDMERVFVNACNETAPCLLPVLTAPARKLEIDVELEDVATYGPCKPNPPVEEVVVSAYHDFCPTTLVEHPDSLVFTQQEMNIMGLELDAVAEQTQMDTALKIVHDRSVRIVEWARAAGVRLGKLVTGVMLNPTTEEDPIVAWTRNGEFIGHHVVETTSSVLNFKDVDPDLVDFFEDHEHRVVCTWTERVHNTDVVFCAHIPPPPPPPPPLEEPEEEE
ncbi:hypothetical protein M3Y99_01272100 [Aphelenchoides fujianensis]|nr:hypothetical protein M3Y99_01272100 [Aphelenchoides fujianensis]